MGGARSTFGSLALAALVLLALPAGSLAASFGPWRVTASGSIKHTWKRTGEAPCAAAGKGQVSAVAHGKTRRFRLSYFEDDGFRNWDISRARFDVRGKVRRTDRTRQNPPKAGDEPCKPTRKDGCGERKLDRRAFGSVEGTIPRRKARITFSFYNLMQAFPPRTRCYSGNFNDFNLFPGAPFAEYGRMVGLMPRPAQVARRRAFTVRLVQKASTRRTKSVRRVKLRFKPA